MNFLVVCDVGIENRQRSTFSLNGTASATAGGYSEDSHAVHSEPCHFYLGEYRRGIVRVVVDYPLVSIKRSELNARFPAACWTFLGI